MLTENVLKRTEGLPDEHYDPKRLLHLAHIANDQMILDLSNHKKEWQDMVTQADQTKEIGMFTVNSPWFYPDDCFDWLVAIIHYDPKEEAENHIFITQQLYCTRLYGQRRLESHFRSFKTLDNLKEWYATPDAGFERYQSLEKLLDRMKEWLD